MDSCRTSEDSDIREARLWAAAGYVGFLCFLPLLRKKENRFALFHGKQALVLFLLEMAAWILRVIPALGEFVFTMAFVVFGILSLIGISKSLLGECWEMPIVGDIAAGLRW
jgi:uncharacterized membrane protein